MGYEGRNVVKRPVSIGYVSTLSLSGISDGMQPNEWWRGRGEKHCTQPGSHLKMAHWLGWLGIIPALVHIHTL